MTLPCVKSPFATAPIAVASALILFLLTTNAVAKEGEPLWAVECGLPTDDNWFLDLMPAGGYTGPWPGGADSGHLEAKTLNRPNPDGGVITEMWLLSRAIGWWKLKAIWVHPDDSMKLAERFIEGAGLSDIRQVIDSPFLSRPVVVRSGDPDGEATVNGQILALLPDAIRLRCAPHTEETD